MEFLRNKFIATIKIESFDNRIIIRFLIEKKSSVDKMDRQKKDSKEASLLERIDFEEITGGFRAPGEESTKRGEETKD